MEKLPGVHIIKTRDRSGRPIEYHYSWRGGPRITARPGTPAYVREYARHMATRTTAAAPGTLSAIIDDWRKSARFTALKPKTRADYERIEAVIRAEFGDMPAKAIEARGARTLFIDWRDTMRATPRSADYHLSVLSSILAFAADRETILRNPLERVERLHHATRSDILWPRDAIARVMTEAQPHLRAVFIMALTTLQRQGDCLTMPTLAWDGEQAWIRQGKTGARVRITPAAMLRPMLEDARKAGRATVLVNSRGDRWTSTGFRASWRKEMTRLKITGVTFHDLRGTGISWLHHNARLPIADIAAISGHSPEEADAIIRRHYLASEAVAHAWDQLKT
ncbi:site-specific integrase [Hoeflea alexandrii]|uniref:integrase n=1 Tax=Hoeflea alexandrii TaxID=288436 RepID=UPI0020948626|nr:integrase [Hoeflea alexandrii]MCY0154289.1 integrase [Hoeflea alexandrii]